MKLRQFFRVRCILSLAVAAGLSLRLAATESETPRPKTHVLFMGTDLSVMRGKKLYRVQDVKGSEFRIRVDGEDILVPTRWRPISLHVDADLKLSGVSVQLDQLQSRPAYTYGNDPMRKLEEASRNNMVMADLKDMSAAAVPRAEANLGAVKEMTSHYTDTARAAREVNNAEWALSGAQRTMESVNFSAGANLNTLSEGASKMALAEGNFDAMEVSFKVSSPVDLDEPYMVILFRFHDPAAKPDVNGLVIHAEALDPIDATPRYVRVLRGGLPPGFKFVDCTVHLYNRGQELATNHSENRVEMTRDQTQQYLVVTYSRAHKGETLPAAIVPGTMPRSQREALTRTQPTKTLFAKVSRDGALLGVFSDSDCKFPLEDADSKAAFDAVLFTPALEQGKPVDGIARVRIADL